jgi:HAD superfamily hydrolase (TIGR01450 family)
VLADSFDVFLLDLDGVVYLGVNPLPGAIDALARLRAMGKTLRFLTNDPLPTRRQVVRRLRTMGVEVHLHEVVTAGWATATYLRAHGVTSAYVVGSRGLAAELEQEGITIVRGEHAEAVPEAVVVGCSEHVGYPHLRRAATWIRRGARFVATGDDGWFPTAQGPWPATGAITAAIRVAAERSPTIVGKPFLPMFASALADLDAGLRIAMVGDTPASDILGAHRAGLTGILVAQDSREPRLAPPHHDGRSPDAVIPNLLGLFDRAVSLRSGDPPAPPPPDDVRLAVAVVIHDRAGRALLTRQVEEGRWDLPWGYVEPSETVTAAVMRVAQEELGLEIHAPRLVGVYSDPASHVATAPDGRVTRAITACFDCQVVGDELYNPGDARTQATFFAPEALPRDLVRGRGQWLADARARQAAAFVR